MAVIGEHIFTQSLVDRCYIDTRTTGSGYGSTRQQVTYTEGTEEIKCRVIQNKTKEIVTSTARNNALADAAIPITDTTVYLPTGTIPAADDRIRVTKRYGKILAVEEIYGVMEIEKQGYGNKILCKQAKGETIK